MNSILRKVMLPGAVAVAMAGFVGAFGGGVSGIQQAEAAEGDICQVAVDSRAGTTHDGQGNDVYVVEKGTTYGLVFRVEDETWVGIDDSEGGFLDYFDETGSNVTVRIDSETGSGRITSKAEVTDFDDNYRQLPAPANTESEDIDSANVAHLLVQPSVGTQTVDTISPRWFNSADGTLLDSINAWLTDVGYPAFADSANNVCGDNYLDFDGGDYREYYDDAWGFIDFECIESGYFHIDILAPGDTEETGRTVKFYCPGQAESATIAVSRSTVETQPTNVPPAGFGWSLVTVTVLDQFGDRLDGAKVTFTTDNCQFRNTGSNYAGAASGQDSEYAISPAAGGTTVTTYSDTDSTADKSFLTDNPLQDEAGTAEVVLDCTLSGSTPGVANITAIVDREGADIVLKETVTVVGPTAATGLTLTLTPDDIECGETILAVATAVDSEGKPVSDGTKIYFTTDTSSGVVGGEEGAQGGVATKGGEASVLIATDPGNPGTHTVIAFTKDQYGRVLSQVSKNYVCDGAVAPVAPTVAPPTTGTGTGSITPPNTGDAGLAAGSSSSSIFVLAGAVALALAGVASVRFARN